MNFTCISFFKASKLLIIQVWLYSNLFILKLTNFHIEICNYRDE